MYRQCHHVPTEWGERAAVGIDRMEPDEELPCLSERRGRGSVDELEIPGRSRRVVTDAPCGEFERKAGEVGLNDLG